ncbi:cation diffusion facilitator family transporter [Rhodococcus aetherivorans]|uniref:Cation diffusion facilitator family transporter n=1 Tax=Rhodococcus aetherivorans TaxID=191292 RepID=A0A059MH34_9NOCA|nr:MULTISPECIES: cation diffusion facilitator family transporter [Rhodococcus]KDE10403.1 transporter [Rhodococcus aetherivorans]MBC2590512.1 cation transporter [Rhodococcus aetherivorans]QIX48335.1 cation transporter [Rhodococcus sp. DMU1]UGQ41108.1 cation diffusion facilitator family transporter [Rhodococcus aetherivorans]UYF94215.1 cation diffusion facilitator family transporter [Rhodococcus aetherivorans]
MGTTSTPESRQRQDRLLFRFMLLSLAAAVVTIVLKASAAWATGSVGFLSDALESGVNLVAAVVALIALRVAARPPDASHHFGHGKAEYVSALVEGAMIFVAATAIVWTAIERLISPIPLVQPGLGLALTTVASLINLAVGITLQRVGRTHRSITLVADGKHLLTDVWTSAGVIVGIVLVTVTGWEPLDPIVALVVGVNILWTGYRLLRGSVSGLLSAALPQHEQDQVNAVLDRFRAECPVEFAPLRTVESGRQRQVFVVVTVPGDWTVRTAHDMADRIEAAIDAVLPHTETFIHVEPATTGPGNA